MRIEAAAYRGRPVFWRLIAPWNSPGRMGRSSESFGESAGRLLFIVLLMTLVFGGAYFARRNLRLGRGDRRGAARLAYLVFTLWTVAWILREHHVPDLVEALIFLSSISWALPVTAFLWLLYIALEPFVRRRWPASLVSWNRLFAGGFRDPLVGRDVLVGCALAAVFVPLEYLSYELAPWIGVSADSPSSWTLSSLLGTRMALSEIPRLVVWCIFWGLATLFLLFLFRVLLRRAWVAATLFVVILTAFSSIPSGSPITWVVAAFEWAIGYVLLTRFGLLAITTSSAFANLFYRFPITPQLSAWYSGIGLAGVVLMLAFAGYAFHTAVAGQPLSGRAALED